MASKRFLGKVSLDPAAALAKGSREVMASIWEEYLAAILQVSAKSGRFKMLRRQIEEAAGFQEVLEQWNTMDLPGRGATWRRLMAAAQEKYEAERDQCSRCGECCQLGSPTLLRQDLPLFQQEIVTLSDTYTLRAGERVTGREGRLELLESERLKIRELPGSRQCRFLRAADSACRIYENRPEQCRRQNCWGEPAAPPAPDEFLTRRDLFAGVPEIWELISEHQKRCDYGGVSRDLTELAAGREETAGALFEALHFDHYLRRMLIHEWEVSPAATELLLGRPVTEFLEAQGVDAILTPEGVFRLVRREDDE